MDTRLEQQKPLPLALKEVCQSYIQNNKFYRFTNSHTQLAENVISFIDIILSKEKPLILIQTQFVVLGLHKILINLKSTKFKEYLENTIMKRYATEVYDAHNKDTIINSLVIHKLNPLSKMNNVPSKDSLALSEYLSIQTLWAKIVFFETISSQHEIITNFMLDVNFGILQTMYNYVYSIHLPYPVTRDKLINKVNSIILIAIISEDIEVLQKIINQGYKTLKYSPAELEMFKNNCIQHFIRRLAYSRNYESIIRNLTGLYPESQSTIFKIVINIHNNYANNAEVIKITASPGKYDDADTRLKIDIVFNNLKEKYPHGIEGYTGDESELLALAIDTGRIDNIKFLLDALDVFISETEFFYIPISHNIAQKLTLSFKNTENQKKVAICLMNHMKPDLNPANMFRENNALFILYLENFPPTKSFINDVFYKKKLEWIEIAFNNPDNFDSRAIEEWKKMVNATTEQNLQFEYYLILLRAQIKSHLWAIYKNLSLANLTLYQDVKKQVFEQVSKIYINLYEKQEQLLKTLSINDLESAQEMLKDYNLYNSKSVAEWLMWAENILPDKSMKLFETILIKEGNYFKYKNFLLAYESHGLFKELSDIISEYLFDIEAKSSLINK